MLAAAALFIGCAPRQTQPLSPEAAVVAAPAGSAARALQAAAAVYGETTGERIRVEVIAADSYQDQVSAALLAGLDRYDLVYLPAESLPRWVNYRALRPMNTPADAEELQPWLESTVFDSPHGRAWYGLPAQPDPLLLWFRSDILDESETAPPFDDWASFAAAAKRINAPPLLYGAAVAGGEFDAGSEFAAALGGLDAAALDALSKRGEVGAAAEQALALLVELSGSAGAVDPEAGTFSRDDVVASLAEGRAAMGFAPVSAAERLLDCAASPKACRDGSPLLKTAPLPGLDGCAGPGSLSVWAVPLNAARADSAGRFAAWLVSADGARAWESGGGIPARRDALQALDLPGSASLGELSCIRSPFIGALNAELAWKALHAAAHAAVINEQTPRNALIAAGEQIHRGLRQSGDLEEQVVPGD